MVIKAERKALLSGQARQLGNAHKSGQASVIFRVSHLLISIFDFRVPTTTMTQKEKRAATFQERTRTMRKAAMFLVKKTILWRMEATKVVTIKAISVERKKIMRRAATQMGRAVITVERKGPTTRMKAPMKIDHSLSRGSLSLALTLQCPSSAQVHDLQQPGAHSHAQTCFPFELPSNVLLLAN